MKIEEKLKGRRQLLEDTIYYYSLFPRCMKYSEDGDYMYPVLSGTTAGLNTAGDVLGRLLSPAKRLSIDMEYEEPTFDEIFDNMPDEIRNLGYKFLIEISVLHDNCCFWEDKKLSKEGEEFVKEIQQNFIENWNEDLKRIIHTI